jgi:hypothetical protein
MGGTILGYEHGGKPKDSEDAICFGRDVMEASNAVLDGSSNRDDFSFIIGAAYGRPVSLSMRSNADVGCHFPGRQQ